MRDRPGPRKGSLRLDPVSLTAGVIAVVGLADQVIKLCHGHIQSVENFPRDIRMILIEISALNDIFQNLLFLNEHDAHCSAMLTSLLGQDGPISACRASMVSLELCLCPEMVDSANKRRRLKLSLESLAWHFKETRVRQAMDEIRRYKETITLAFSSEVIDNVVPNGLADSQRQEVYKWLRHVDPSPNHNAARDFYEADTGNWVLRDPEWFAWIRLQRRCLWIHGIPGAGKTILASHLIEQINEAISHSQEPNKPVACVYYYCYYGRNQDERDPLLWWMLDQLCRHLHSVPCSVKRVYDHGRQPATRELLKCIEELLTAVHAVYLVVDAVDAVDESLERHNLLETLRHFCTKPEFARLQILVTSREYVDIAGVLTPISQPLSMANPQVAEDIKSYTQSRLETDRQFRRWSPSLREEVKKVLSSGAKGMFRWAACQLDILRRLSTDAEIRQGLKTLPESLDGTYMRILCSVDKVLRPFLRYTVRWIIFLQSLGLRPFSAIQIAQAYVASVETDSDQSYTMPGNMQVFIDTLLEACGCLVTLHKSSGNEDLLQLAHFTVSEFLRSTRITSTPAQYFAILPTELFLNTP
ncbi:hypothetical protein QBC37DRAFT_443447 [Rhypophila decipiens]|uniref:NACHT domain-containing protein n=1 Tax=Rhypophila decipiens TaxID=261697 RepID=A0AAN7B426_9PEZI|nr:hypothetical protein QBC37DRAFT_443447 [Rhypophila decipiens]